MYSEGEELRKGGLVRVGEDDIDLGQAEGQELPVASLDLLFEGEGGGIGVDALQGFFESPDLVHGLRSYGFINGRGV